VGNTLVVRTDLSGNPGFGALRDRVATSIATAQRHADLPFDLLVSELRPRRDLSRNPVCQVALSLERGCAATSPARVSGGTLFDLTLFLVDDRGFTVKAEYNRELFDAETIIRMLDHFETLLEAALADGNIPVSELQLLTDAERGEIVNDWNQTATAIGSTVLLSELFEAQAAATPQAIAVQANGHAWSYAELNSRANQIAHYLRALGVGPETLVGVCLDRSVEMLAALLGILKAGGAYVPLDPTFPADRLSYMVKDARLSFAVTTGALSGLIDSRVERIVRIDEPFAAQPQMNLPPVVGGDHLAYVIYTSGSTGTPKGVQVRHKALVNLLLSMRDKVRTVSSDRLLAVTTLSFDIAGLELYMPLLAGARVVITNRDVATDGHLLARTLNDSAATMMQATPATWRLLIGTGWQPPAGFRILCGGEALAPDLAAELAGRGETWNLYGPTETTIWASVDQVHGDDAITIGRPLANTRMYVLDASLSPVPVGVVGQLYIGGEALARGYTGRVDLTAGRFVPDPFAVEPGSRLYGTGDLVRFLRDGRIEWIARVDHQVKVRGYRIELKEIESCLMASPAVRDAVVCIDGVADDRRLVAYIVFHPGESLTASELRRYVKQTLPAYMVPSFFVKLDRVPLTPSGKVDRKALPDPFAHAAREAQTAPKTPMEIWLAEIWQEALDGAPIGAHDNFFDVGGHSLLSMRVIAEIEARTGHRLDPRAMVFENLDQIAARLDRAGVRPQADTAASGAVVRT
jgi:amino acid adenylation domain-containing protein